MLYVLFIPGFCLKQNKLLHSLLFSLCLYLTYDIVDHSVENYENEHSVELTGMNNLAELINKGIEKRSKTVTINNKIKSLPKKYYENEDSDLLTSSYKTIDDLKTENKLLDQNLKAYEGSKEEADKLKIKMNDYKNLITDLKTQINSYKGTNQSADELNTLVNKLQSEIYSLKIQLANSTQKTK